VQEDIAMVTMRSAVIVLLVLACASPATAQMIGPDGRLVVPERRTLQWAAGLGGRDLLERTYARITRLTGDGPGAWAYEWSVVAREQERQAADAAQKGDAATARAAYLAASYSYALGYFPDNATPSCAFRTRARRSSCTCIAPRATARRPSSSGTAAWTGGRPATTD
jgi:hypothetical protein